MDQQNQQVNLLDIKELRDREGPGGDDNKDIHAMRAGCPVFMPAVRTDVYENFLREQQKRKDVQGRHQLQPTFGEHRQLLHLKAIQDYCRAHKKCLRKSKPKILVDEAAQ